jgi:hypothetical protein
MAHLTLTAVSDDGRRLLLANDAGEEFTLDVDARLRAALRGDTARLGQLETPMDSALRPRDIQARIRSGETPEAVAQAAQTTVDKIMAFAAPVLAERQHVAERAQRSSVRRRSGSDQSSGARTLGDAVAAHLRSVNVDPTVVVWDAWRREDGRWCLTGEFGTTMRSGHGRFTFDMPGNYVVADNDDARWLLGDLVETPRPAARNDLEQARQRRLSAVRPGDAEELPLGDAPGEALGDDAIELVTGEQPLEAFLTEEAPPAEELELREQASDAAALDEAPEAPVEPVVEETGEEPAAEADPAPAADEPPSRRPVRKSRGRASVPSWDEIMFGGGKSE